MSPKWIIFVVMLYGFGTLFGLILEGAFPGGEATGVLNTLINSKVLTATTLFGKLTAAATDLAFWGAIINMLFWNFSFWQGPLALVKWLLFLPISAGVVIALALAVFRGVGSGS